MIRNIPGLRKTFSGVPNLDPVIQIIEEFEKQIKVLKVLAHRTDSGKETLVNFMLELSGNFSSLLERVGPRVNPKAGEDMERNLILRSEEERNDE